MRHLPALEQHPIAVRRCLGLLWSCVWSSVLTVQVSAWAGLGGLVPESARWWHRAALFGGLSLGYHVARFCRELPYRHRRSHARWLRWVGIPPGLAGALLLVALNRGGYAETVGIVVAGWTAYASGLDLGFGILPLLRGEEYRFGVRPAPEAFEGPHGSAELDDEGLEDELDSRR